MAIREGAWDCSACGRAGIRGSKKFCGGCGHPRGEDVTFYLPEDAPEITDEEELRRAAQGPDWNCSYCGSDNSSEDTYCSGCGASAEGAERRETRMIRDDAEKPETKAETQASVTPPKKKLKFSKGCMLGCAGAVVVGIILLIIVYFISRPSDAELRVDGFQWDRTIQVETLKTLTETGWEGEIPHAARIMSKKRDVHHYDKIQIGTEKKTRTVTDRKKVGTKKVKVGVKDLGNGYFEDVYEDRPVYEDVKRTETIHEPIYRKDPVYRNRITYQVDRWTKTPDQKAGAKNRQPSWPSLGPKDRAVKKDAVYTILFKDSSGDLYPFHLTDEAEWKKFEMGEIYQAKVVTFTKKVERIGKRIRP